ncbi:MAG: hypothetical protein M0D57_05330 [Sphingobacteriales bacterium JAD_PAG50586_3]|nr:MAG: hypothetical protein M0D57_05330 [Sphingobacteriales bacterium JAD_PAG50586_3]
MDCRYIIRDKKIQFQINKDANINFIKDFYVEEEYTLVDGKYWMRSYEKVVADFNPYVPVPWAFTGAKPRTTATLLLTNPLLRNT